MYKGLSDESFRILAALNSLTLKYEYVPLEEIERTTKLTPSRIIKSLRELIDVKAVVKHRTTQSFRLTYLGLDLVALKKLSDSGVLGYLGTRVGVGKESEIYIAKTPAEKIVAVKFYKIGRVSFQKIKRVRTYALDESRWFMHSRNAASREYEVLSKLSNYTSFVPRVYAHVEHSVVMDYVDGIELYRYKTALMPENILRSIMTALRSAYVHLGIVHGDLSEYNILVSVGEGEKPYIIDWPQYVYRDEPGAEKLLFRDVSYMVKFFKENYGLEKKVGDCLEFVKGLRDEF
ncbi:MAG: RIO1 family regulatory kinase/ATPase [Desulfurococcaceae archaeon TW002]